MGSEIDKKETDLNETDIYRSSGYGRTRTAYILECAFEYFVALAVTDAFLAKLLKSIGASDALCGIISSFISLALLFQLLSLFIVGKITNTKKTAVIIHTCSQLLFTALYLIPFLPFGDAYKRPVFIICMLMAYLGNYIITSVIYKWGTSFVDPGRRARYSSAKEMTSLASGIAVSLILGAVIDKFDSEGNIYGGFIFTAICMAIFSLCDFICLMLMKNEQTPDVREKEPLLPVLKHIFSNREFVRAIVINCLYNISVYTTFGFLGTYKQEELAYTIVQIQIINIIGVACRFAVSRPFGKFSDKHTYYNGIMLGMTILAASFAACMFAAPGSRFLIILFVVLYNVSSAGTSQNMINITYSYVPEKYFVQATVIKRSIAGVMGFLATLASGKLLSAIQAGGNHVFGITVYSQQIQAAISLCTVVFTIVYMAASRKTMIKS
ncbi:MAG: MFS transporter [Clostridia bacterium]|nr:MFS transporter [Clostridia bacterium]